MLVCIVGCSLLGACAETTDGTVAEIVEIQRTVEDTETDTEDEDSSDSPATDATKQNEDDDDVDFATVPCELTGADCTAVSGVINLFTNDVSQTISLKFGGYPITTDSQMDVTGYNAYVFEDIGCPADSVQTLSASCDGPGGSCQYALATVTGATCSASGATVPVTGLHTQACTCE